MIISVLRFFFSHFQEMVTKEYQNFKFQQPYQQAMNYCSLILQDDTWPWMDGLEVIPCLDADDLANFVPMLLSRASLECYIAGSYISTSLFSFLEVLPWSYYYHLAISFFRKHRTERSRVNDRAH